MGRPSSYKKEYAVQAVHLTKLGAIDKDLALFFGVAVTTINTWKEKYSEFLLSIKTGKEDADNAVKQSLFKRANGYSHPEDKIFNNNGEPLVVPTTKHYPPDSTACIFWLTNRDSDNWKRNIEPNQDTGNMADVLSKLIDKLPS